MLTSLLKQAVFDQWVHDFILSCPIFRIQFNRKEYTILVAIK